MILLFLSEYQLISDTGYFGLQVGYFRHQSCDLFLRYPQFVFDSFVLDDDLLFCSDDIVFQSL